MDVVYYLIFTFITIFIFILTIFSYARVIPSEINLKGPRGNQGPLGTNGPQGEQGLPGNPIRYQNNVTVYPQDIIDSNIINNVSTYTNKPTGLYIEIGNLKKIVSDDSNYISNGIVQTYNIQSNLKSYDNLQVKETLPTQLIVSKNKFRWRTQKNSTQWTGWYYI